MVICQILLLSFPRVSCNHRQLAEYLILSTLSDPKILSVWLPAAAGVLCWDGTPAHLLEVSPHPGPLSFSVPQPIWLTSPHACSELEAVLQASPYCVSYSQVSMLQPAGVVQLCCKHKDGPMAPISSWREAGCWLGVGLLTPPSWHFRADNTSMFWMLEGHRSEIMTTLLWAQIPQRSKLKWKPMCEPFMGDGGVVPGE